MAGLYHTEQGDMQNKKLKWLHYTVEIATSSSAHPPDGLPFGTIVVKVAPLYCGEWSKHDCVKMAALYRDEGRYNGTNTMLVKSGCTIPQVLPIPGISLPTYILGFKL